MEDFSWDMEQALPGLGLCPRSAPPASLWHTGLLEAPQVLPSGFDSSGLAGDCNIGEFDQPPSPDVVPPECPQAGEYPRFPGAYSLWGEESGKSDRGAAAARPQTVQFAPDDFDVVSQDGDLYSPVDDYMGLESQPQLAGEGTGWGDQSGMWSGDTVIHRPPETQTRGRARVRQRKGGF